MSVLIVIPARYQSSRFLGKPLQPLVGSTGKSKTLIERSYLAAKSVSGNHDIVVATDDDRIKSKAISFGANVVMTSSDAENGTERVAEVTEQLDKQYDIIINLQGDAPLTPPWFVEALINAMERDPSISVATPVLRCDAETLSSLKYDRVEGRVGGTTAVFTSTNDALFFSKEVIPYTDNNNTPIPVFHHVGVYGYRPSALKNYITWKAGPLESNEGLEQLRFLENNSAIKCVEVDAKGRHFWELNNPSDVELIEKYLKALGAE